MFIAVFVIGIPLYLLVAGWVMSFLYETAEVPGQAKEWFVSGLLWPIILPIVVGWRSRRKTLPKAVVEK